MWILKKECPDQVSKIHIYFLLSDKNGKNLSPVSDQNGQKSITLINKRHAYLQCTMHIGHRGEHPEQDQSSLWLEMTLIIGDCL